MESSDQTVENEASLDSLTPEQWEEVGEVIREVWRYARVRTQAGRSSMSIDIDAALMLAGIAAAAHDAHAPSLEKTAEKERCAWGCPICRVHHENACPSLFGGELTLAPCGHRPINPSEKTTEEN